MSGERSGLTTIVSYKLIPIVPIVGGKDVLTKMACLPSESWKRLKGIGVLNF
jgi:hypothetical protein